MEAIQKIIDRMHAKIENHKGVEAKIVLREDQGVLYVAIHKQNMRKEHRSVRGTILHRIRGSHRLKRFTTYLYLCPRHPGVACTTWVLKPGASNWELETKDRLPLAELVA